jgi:hypothetical protein
MCRGADCITRSLANCSAEGGAIDSPGGGPFLRPVIGVFMPDLKELLSGPCRGVSASPFLPPLLLASMSFLCCSRTLMLRSSCSRMDGSWVLNPGERQASPTSCRASPALSLDVRGAEGRAESAPPDMLLCDERLRRLGLCLGVGS